MRRYSVSKLILRPPKVTLTFPLNFANLGLSENLTVGNFSPQNTKSRAQNPILKKIAAKLKF